MPRFLSEVTGRASSWPGVCTQTWSTSFLSGARNARVLPSGEIWGNVLTGLPNNTLRGMIGGSPARAAGVSKHDAASRVVATRMAHALAGTESDPPTPRESGYS